MPRHKPDPVIMLRDHEARCTQRYNWIMAMLGGLALVVLGGWMYLDSKWDSRHAEVQSSLLYIMERLPNPDRPPAVKPDSSI